MQRVPIFRCTYLHLTPPHPVHSPSTRDEVKQVGDGVARPVVRSFNILVRKNPVKLFRVRGRNGLWPGRRLAFIVEMEATISSEQCHHDGYEQEPFGHSSTPLAASDPNQGNGF